MVVPEIDIPGHSLAALAAYPQFGCTGGPYQVAQKMGIFPELYCAGKEKTFTFLQNILEEVIELFPSPYIHIGGDETSRKRWKACPACQERIRLEGLGDEIGLKVYFVNRMAAFLVQHKRTPIGYSETCTRGWNRKPWWNIGSANPPNWCRPCAAVRR
jgi:hexosaminidase